MKEIVLTRGKVSLVDAWNYDWLNQFKWFAHRDVKGRWYAVRNVRLPNGKQTRQLMHRAIMGNPEGLEIDHKDRAPEGGLDNREANLRVASLSQNRCNTGVRKDSKSGFKGVTWNAKADKWSARIWINKRCIFLGYFDSPIEAAKVYNDASVKYHGEFGFQNPLPEEQGLLAA
jgi:hypothetical protein